MTPRASSTSGIMVSPNKVRPAKENPRGIRQRFTSDRERPTRPERTKGPPSFICASKGDVLNCRGKVPSLRRGGLPGSFNLPRELRMSPLPTLSFFATTCRILIYHGRGTEQWSGGSDRAAAGSSEFKGRGGQGQDIMKRCDVGSGLWQQALGRRAWLRLAGAAALAGIPRGVESDPATMHDPPARGPAEEELEQAKAAARKVTSGTLGTVQSAHFQAVGDATEPYMNQMLLDCERIALDFLWYYRS